MTPTTIVELAEFLKNNPLVSPQNTIDSTPKIAYVSKDILYFTGSAEFLTLNGVEFDEKGFQLKNSWNQIIRYNYVKND